MRAVSLFSGAGGFEVGFDLAGIETVLQAESDAWALKVLEHHWPDVERVTDVRDISEDDAAAWARRCGDMGRGRHELDAQRVGGAARPAAAPDIGLVYGGWPCQGNSVAGKRRGLSDARSGLWSEVRRVLSELRPRWFVGENVPGLLSINRGLDFGRVLMDLDDLGYGVAWRVVDARWFGVPQRRRRVLVVGCLGDAAPAAQILAVCESCGGHPPTGAGAGEDDPAGAGAGAAEPGALVADIGELGRERSNPRSLAELPELVTAVTAKWSKGSSGPSGDETHNMLAGDDGLGVRRLTPTECERLQGFPDGWTAETADGRPIPDGARYRLMGNAVATVVAQWLGHRLVAVDSMLDAQEAVA